MRAAVFILSLTILALWASPARALTVEEILALKKAGVSEQTIQMLLEREREEREAAERSEAWRTPETDYPDYRQDHPQENPWCVYPEIRLLPPSRRSR